MPVCNCKPLQLSIWAELQATHCRKMPSNEVSIPYVCKRGENTNVTYLKDYNGQHKQTVGDMCLMDVWGRWCVRAELLAHLIEEKVRLCLNYSPRDIMEDLELELRICLTYTLSWRAREFVQMMVLGWPEGHYKLLLWMCGAIVRANPGLVPFCEVHELRFCRMFET